MKHLFTILLVAVSAILAAENDIGIDIFDKLQTKIIEASDHIKDRVVHIEAITRKNQQTIRVQASGLIIDSLGHIITNEHVVDKAEKLTITVPGFENKFDAVIVGTDKLTDLALIRMNEPLLFLPVAWADIKKTRVGDWVIAIGNPYGLDGTVSFGIISAKGRAVPAEGLLNDFLQTDAMIDVGSSGGPLINLKGEVLGVNSMIIGRGIGFTVPADIVQEIISKLYQGHEIERSWVGIGIQPLGQDYAKYFGIPDKKGVIVTGIFDKSPAEKAGLTSGEIIISVDGEVIKVEKDEELNQFKRKIADHMIGETVIFEVYNPVKKKTRNVKIKTENQPTSQPREVEVSWGFVAKEITPLSHRENFLFSLSGTVVTYVRNGSEAEVAGLTTWDIIQGVDDIKIETVNDFENAYKKVHDKDTVMLRVLRNRDTFFVLIQKYGEDRD
jgi:S1-C subfamily serine protease